MKRVNINGWKGLIDGKWMEKDGEQMEKEWKKNGKRDGKRMEKE